MKNYRPTYSVTTTLPMVFVLKNEKVMLTISHVISTLTALALVYMTPWAIPFYMAQIQNSKII